MYLQYKSLCYYITRLQLQEYFQLLEGFLPRKWKGNINDINQIQFLFLCGKWDSSHHPNSSFEFAPKFDFYVQKFQASVPTHFIINLVQRHVMCTIDVPLHSTSNYFLATEGTITFQVSTLRVVLAAKIARDFKRAIVALHDLVKAVSKPRK